MTRPTCIALPLLVFALATAHAQEPVPAGPISVHPPAVELRHQRQPQSLQVLGSTADGYTLDLHAQATFTSANPAIATVDATGWVQPVASGQTQISIAAGGQTVAV